MASPSPESHRTQMNSVFYVEGWSLEEVMYCLTDPALRGWDPPPIIKKGVLYTINLKHRLLIRKKELEERMSVSTTPLTPSPSLKRKREDDSPDTLYYDKSSATVKRCYELSRIFREEEVSLIQKINCFRELIEIDKSKVLNNNERQEVFDPDWLELDQKFIEFLLVSKDIVKFYPTLTWKEDLEDRLKILKRRDYSRLSP